MSEDAKIAELEAEVLRVSALRRVGREADDMLEEAQRDRLPLEQTIARMFPVLRDRTGAAVALVNTFDEAIELRDFVDGAASFPIPSVELRDVTDRGSAYFDERAGFTVLAQRIDVAGELFGVSALAFEGSIDDEIAGQAREMLDTWTEVLDNYLSSIAQARTKAEVTRRIGAALHTAVLDDGIGKAIAVLQESVDFDELLLVYQHESDPTDASLHFKRVHRGVLVDDARVPHEEGAGGAEGEWARQLIGGSSPELLSGIGLDRFREDVLINGVRDDRVVGRILVSSSRGEFNTYDRDLLERFGEYLRLRVVDFNREWKNLSRYFRAADVRRLLDEPDYESKRLAATEQEVAILFADISGFTRISEQVLGEPPLIGKLIDTWGETVVKIVWETGGVFDKMVGDCVIAFWGPPFHEMSPKEACERAADAARRIRDYTRSMNEGRELPELKGLEPPVGVATGLNYCPVFIGRFGPDEDYTAFSSGMNNTARLQGVATHDQILCMDSFVGAHATPEAYGEEGSAKVKNVAEPLCYRYLV